jgi:acyl-coenzyme A thioesterase PaaI-like protein
MAENLPVHRSLLARQPNSKHCFVCGLESEVGLKLRFDDNGVDKVRSVFTVPGQYQGYPGVVHGGIIAAMLDEIAGRVIMIGHHNRFMMTGKLDLKYRKPVPIETPLTLIGRLIRDKGRLAEAHSELRLPDGSLAVEAEVTLVQIPSDTLADTDLEALGWRIYPDGQDSQ